MSKEFDSFLREVEKWNNYWETAPQEEIEKDAAEINKQIPVPDPDWLMDENDYPLLEGTLNLTRSPLDILIEYVRVRYGNNQSFDNLVTSLKIKEAKQITSAYDLGYFDGLHEASNK